MVPFLSHDADFDAGWFGQRFKHIEIEKAYANHVASENAKAHNTMKYVLCIVYLIAIAIHLWSIDFLLQKFWYQAFLMLFMGFGIMMFWIVHARYLEYAQTLISGAIVISLLL